ncbi:putative cell division protein FtsL [Leptotrichia sp. oral taxon 215 str. W9775]|jgi:putative septum formation initiator|uniref:FtsB family cell division protein n=1 Tax=Leptotrichia sp. oral taxon 215 TaxID=712359 RepID=UPI0003AD922F|nr:septum formation initiator family protein [Leptotrichia sp. oral taxon 215]ERK66398.1 putative cell division protein FtsL [Leptotrichia sp. oral taxon 215 str. W9775]
MGKKLFVVFNIGFVLLLGIMLYQAFRIYLMKESINTEIIMLEEKVNEYAEKKKNLQSKIDNFSEEEKIERIARDRLNMKKEGEVVYKVVE